uniref:Uncharacterized protein n=1 Tax=Arundo donax TaxID=35708 RepID=A0A0A8YIQ9_ARUDO
MLRIYLELPLKCLRMLSVFVGSKTGFILSLKMLINVQLDYFGNA